MNWWSHLPDPERIERAGAIRAGVTGLATLHEADVPAGCPLQTALALPGAAYHARQPPAVPWPHGFRPFQHHGIAALLQRPALLLADDMGLGKTVQAAAALRILMRRRDVEDALLVVPAALIGQWTRALRLWAPELRVSQVRGSASDRAWQWRAPAHLFITSYETLRSDLTDNPYSPPRRRQWGVALLDEAQKIKNRDVDLSRACKRIPRRRSWALTGTPLENRLEDLASVCEFLVPWHDGDPAPRMSVGPRLLDFHAATQLRRRKIDVLPELPEKIHVDVRLELGPEQRSAYERAEREGVAWLRSLGQAVRITHVLELILRLKQICNVDPRTGASTKLDDLEQRLETLRDAGYKSLVFSQFVDDHGLAAIRHRLARFAPLVYSGALSGDERDDVVRRFREGPPGSVLLISLRAGGFGLDLPEASYVFHFDRWWNPAVERQAEDRAHRIGRDGPVTVYHYLTENTIEERIDEVIAGKQELFDRVVDRVSLDLTNVMNAEELFGLFDLRASTLRA
jgi:SNF2 family DNA or RNA helicase